MSCVEYYFYQQVSWVKEIFSKKERKSDNFLVSGSVTFVEDKKVIIEGDIIDDDRDSAKSKTGFIAHIPEILDDQVKNCEDAEIVLKKSSTSSLFVKDFICHDDF
jgi:hypothetical protein